MENAFAHSLRRLQNTPYRMLQRTAKALGLPANVKKVYLVELIHTKHHKGAAELAQLVQVIKEQRPSASQERALGRSHHRIQEEEISSTSSTMSPPRRRRARRKLRYSPELRVVRYKPPRLPRPAKISPHQTYRGPRRQSVLQRRFTLNGSDVRVLRSSKEQATPSDSGTRGDEAKSKENPNIKIVGHVGGQQFNVIVFSEKKKNDMVDVTIEDADCAALEYMESDSRVSASAHAQLGTSVDAVERPFEADARADADADAAAVELADADPQPEPAEGPLPRIVDVFARFRGAGVAWGADEQHLLRPIYVHVGEEADRGVAWASPLERLYTLRTSWLPHRSPLGAGGGASGGASATRLVYSTPTVVTAMPQPEPQPGPGGGALHGFRSLAPIHVSGAGAGAGAVAGAGAGDGALGGIPDMVDDAMEFISQDGDYLERINSDGGEVRCVLCDWRGPRFMLEYHLGQEHAADVEWPDSSEWSAAFALDALAAAGARFAWRVARLGGRLLALGARLLPPARLQARLHVVPGGEWGEAPPRARLRVPGAPHCWQGAVPAMSAGHGGALLDVPLGGMAAPGAHAAFLVELRP